MVQPYCMRQGDRSRYIGDILHQAPRRPSRDINAYRNDSRQIALLHVRDICGNGRLPREILIRSGIRSQGRRSIPVKQSIRNQIHKESLGQLSPISAPRHHAVLLGNRITRVEILVIIRQKLVDKRLDLIQQIARHIPGTITIRRTGSPWRNRNMINRFLRLAPPNTRLNRHMSVRPVRLG